MIASGAELDQGFIDSIIKICQLIETLISFLTKNYLIRIYPTYIEEVSKEFGGYKTNY